MVELFKVLTLEEAQKLIAKHYSASPIEIESVSLKGAVNRVLAVDIFSPTDLPTFERSTVDGYAVRAEDTFGASPGLPAYLTIVGEVRMGKGAKKEIREAEAIRISTGGMLPPGANAVVMVEQVEEIDKSSIEVMRSVAPGENVIRRGEDLKKESLVLAKGSHLRPQDIGLLAAIGITKVEVHKQPQVAIISTGDEVVEPEIEPDLGQIRDVNSYALSAFVSQMGGIPLRLGIVPDDYGELKLKIEEALNFSDLIIISGGSSKGSSDLVSTVIDDLGKPGVLIHGLALKPGKPTVVGLVGKKLIFGLPGHPVSAMVVFHLLVKPLLEKMLGREEEVRTVKARIGRNVSSVAGREDYLPVTLEEREGGLWVIPILGKSGLISILVKARGMVRIPLKKEGLEEGELVEVKLF